MPRGGTTASVKKISVILSHCSERNPFAFVTLKLSVSALTSGSLPCHYATAKAVSLDISEQKWRE